MNVFGTQRIDTSPDELLALFSCENRVLSRLWSIQSYEGCVEQLETSVKNADLLQTTFPRQINQSKEGDFQESVQG